MGVVPPRKPEPLYFGRREVIVLILGMLATVAATIILLESEVTDARLIVGAPIVIAVLFVTLAFYRDRAHGDPFEERFLRIYRFYRRERYLVKGASSKGPKGILNDQSGLDELEWIAVAGMIVVTIIFILQSCS
jgi:hypothetical protein